MAGLNAKEGELRVCIVGAGVSGLTVCKHLLQHGFDPMVLEAKKGVGGVWRSTYSSTRLQSHKSLYQYTDFPWPDSTAPFPSHHQVVEYLENYARRFALFSKIQFGCKVAEIRRANNGETSAKEFENCCSSNGPTENGGGIAELGVGKPFAECVMKAMGSHRWDVRVRRRDLNASGCASYHDEWLQFDYLVMCCGRFGDVPNAPSFPASQGLDVFQGQVLHSMDYSNLDPTSADALVSGKRVVVVGFQKTSLDVVVEVAEANRGASFIQRYLAWPSLGITRASQACTPQRLLLCGWLTT